MPFSSLTGAQDFNNPDLWTGLRNPDQFNIDLQARYNLGGALKMKEQKLDIVLLMVNLLSSAAASALTETPKAKNNNFSYATGFGHFGLRPQASGLRLKAKARRSAAVASP